MVLICSDGSHARWAFPRVLFISLRMIVSSNLFNFTFYIQRLIDVVEPGLYVLVCVCFFPNICDSYVNIHMCIRYMYIIYVIFIYVYMRIFIHVNRHIIFQNTCTLACPPAHICTEIYLHISIDIDIFRYTNI